MLMTHYGMNFMSVSTENISPEAAQTAANFSSTFLASVIFIVILIAVVLILTGKKLPL